MLLLEDNLSAAVKNLLSTETELRIANSFIGSGLGRLIGANAGSNVKIIFNLTMGGTNPKEVSHLIQRFGKANVKQIDNLHAKLYIGKEYAIVGSANMSTNGLGTQPIALREAGYKFTLDEPSEKRSADWFDELWRIAYDITDQNLKDAEDMWKRRDPVREGDPKVDLGDICNYDFDLDDFPLITWFTNSEWVFSKKLRKGKTEQECEEIEEEVCNSVDIECEDDINHLDKGRYIFSFAIQGDKASGESECYTFRSRGIVVREAYHRKNNSANEVDVMLCDKMSPLFGLNQQSLYDEFRDLINTEKFHLL
ncbi:MAG: phospholipase D family protein [Rhodoferax sp.]|nr:phospholipase D family protein [Rhodoferax sp.]